jgi:hypothetical protein
MIKLSEYLDVFIENLLKSRLFDFLLLNSIIFREDYRGIRVIYYWVNEDDQIFFLVAYPKSVKDNLTDKETAILRQLVKEQFHG